MGLDAVLHLLEYPTALEAAGVIAAAFAAWGAARTFGPAPGRIRVPKDVPSPDALSRLASVDRPGGLVPLLLLAEVQLDGWIRRAAVTRAVGSDGGGRPRPPDPADVSSARRLRTRVHRLRLQAARGNRSGWGRGLLPRLETLRHRSAVSSVEELLQAVDQRCRPLGGPG